MRDYKAISYQFTPAFFTSHIHSHITETLIGYTAYVPCMSSAHLLEAVEKV